MARSKATFSGLSRDTARALFIKLPPSPRWRRRVTAVLLGIALLTCLGIVAFALVREMTIPSQSATAARSQPPAPPRPPLTRAEEAYIQALWPIHGEVERSTMRMSLGEIFYKIQDLSRAELKTRVDEALATYRRAERRLLALQPPLSLQRAHDEYLAAVRLFQKSAIEALRMFDDGSDDHLLAAHPLSLEGSNRIREVGAKFWPEEFPPN
ncbi:MAG: hypothetical protein AUH29_03535 [Candidatus Rokubacteria bacterium 13_1_40CM_69_27]|nr:MAG: hypothetical protein AUH29_03535 [Candidatus Rokubacteria bacterium 13_1_40CM_69_27]